MSHPSLLNFLPARISSWNLLRQGIQRKWFYLSTRKNRERLQNKGNNLIILKNVCSLINNVPLLAHPFWKKSYVDGISCLQLKYGSVKLLRNTRNSRYLHSFWITSLHWSAIRYWIQETNLVFGLPGVWKARGIYREKETEKCFQGSQVLAIPPFWRIRKTVALPVCFPN